MKIKAFILILCMLLLVSCSEAIEFTDTEDDYYGFSENVEEPEDDEGPTYLINTNSKKIHYIHCGTGERTSEKNRDYFTGDISYLLENGYTTCKNCFE